MKTKTVSNELAVIEDKKAYDKMGLYTSNPISSNLGMCQEQFRQSMEVHADSINEALIIKSYTEGDHYSYETLQELADAKRPAEAYNLMLRVERLLVGYFKKVVTTAVGEAVTPQDTITAHLHNEHFKLAQRLSTWSSTMSDIIRDLVTVGQGAWQYKVTDTGRKDALDRGIYDISFERLNAIQVLPDSRAVKPDRSDAKFIHYWEYLSYDEVVEEFGEEEAYRLRISHQVDGGEDLEGIAFTNQTYSNLDRFEYWADGTSYFIVRTYNRDKSGSITMTSWHGDLELGVETLDVEVFPVQAISVLNKTVNNRYYSIMWEALPSQDAINQALLQFQKLVGEERVLADGKAMREDEVPAFNKKLKTIGEVLFVRNINGIKIVNLTREAQAHLSKMYTSIQLILEVIGINEAFLGQSKAGDSGRKFEGQRSASENTLDYLFTPIDLIYKTMYIGCVHYTSVYKQATEQLRFVDDFGRSRWETVNEPFFMPTGEFDEEGLPEIEPIKEERFNKGKGVWQISYVNERGKSLSDIALEVEVRSAPYDDSDAVELAFMESMMNGIAGQVISSSHPAGIPYIYSLMSANLKTKNSETITKYLSTLSEQLGGFNIEDPRLYDSKSFGASGGGNSGGIQYAGGTTNDTQPDGYNSPTTQQAPNMKPQNNKNEGQ